MSDELKEPADYVSLDDDGNTVVDHAAMLADLTGTEAEGWESAEGPDSGCGESYYYRHDRNALWGRINDDQGSLSITVTDDDEDEVAEGTLDISELKDAETSGEE